MQALNIKKKNALGPSLNDIEKRLEKNPKDVDILCELADKYFAENKIDNAFQVLLDNYFLDNNKIKKSFLKFFEALGNSHEKTQEFRKKLSSILFS